MTSHGAHRDGVALALGDLVIDLADVLGLPGGVGPMAGGDIGRLDGGGQGGALANALFELSDLELESVEGFDLLGDTSTRLRGKPEEGCLEPGPAGAGEDVAVLRAGDAVLGQGSVDAVL